LKWHNQSDQKRTWKNRKTLERITATNCHKREIVAKCNRNTFMGKNTSVSQGLYYSGNRLIEHRFIEQTAYSSSYS